MEPAAPPAPPESAAIKLAREAADMTMAAAAEASRGHGGDGVSVTYWRDVERGYGGRRGQRVTVRASDRKLAAMARVVGATPASLTAAGREGAARVLEETLRRAGRPAPPSGRDRHLSLFGDLPPAVADLARRQYAEIAPVVLTASAVHPGPLTGEQVFPADPPAAAAWDHIAAIGRDMLPGTGFTVAEIAQALAVNWMLDPARQDGQRRAAG